MTRKEDIERLSKAEELERMGPIPFIIEGGQLLLEAVPAMKNEQLIDFHKGAARFAAEAAKFNDSRSELVHSMSTKMRDAAEVELKKRGLIR